MAAGDHISVKRLKGAYEHHGIDMGDGTVIHFSGEPLRQTRATVCQVPMDEFLAGGEKVIVQYAEDIEDLLPVEETLRLASSRLGRSGYQLFRNNCEHFATYCKTGQGYSGQVKKYVKAGVTLAATGVLMVTSYAVASRLSGRKRHRHA